MTSAQGKKMGKKYLIKIQDVQTKKKYLLVSLIKTRCFQFRNYFSVSSVFFFLLLANDLFSWGSQAVTFKPGHQVQANEVCTGTTQYSAEAAAIPCVMLPLLISKEVWMSTPETCTSQGKVILPRLFHLLNR